MKLAYPLLNTPIEFDENYVSVLVIENARELRKAIISLKQQVDGGQGEFVLSENHETVEIAKSVLFVSDPFSPEIDSKKISSKINQDACKSAAEYYEEFCRIICEINMLAEKISASMEYDASFTELEAPDQLIKLLDFCVDTDEISFAEALLTYMKLNRMFFGKKLTVIYNLKACMSVDEIKLFYKSVRYEKLQLMLIEDTQRREQPDDEKAVIIDNDLCVF